MYTLALDTSAQAASVALYAQDKLIGEVWSHYHNNHSEKFLGLVDHLLSQHHIQISTIEKLVVLNGPGSYTGLRIALATAKAFAQPFNTPIYSVSTLDAVAYQQMPYEGLVVVIMDARNGQIYGAAYAFKPNHMTEVVPKGAYEIHAFIAELPADSSLLLCGDGADLYQHLLREKTDVDVILAPTERMTQRASGGAAFVLSPFYKAVVTGHHGLKADYLRKSQAERELGKRV